MKQEFAIKILLPDGRLLEPLVMKEILEKQPIFEVIVFEVIEISTPKYWNWEKQEGS